MILKGTKPKTNQGDCTSHCSHNLTKTAVSKHLGTGSLISTGLYGNTKIPLRDRVFTTIIDDIKLKQNIPCPLKMSNHCFASYFRVFSQHITAHTNNVYLHVFMISLMNELYTVTLQTK